MPELVYPLRAGRGAVIKVLVRHAGPTWPGESPPVVGPLAAYLDTGAGITLLDQGVIRSLGLKPKGEAGLHVLGRDDVSFHGVYDVEIALAVETELPRWLPLTVLEGTVNPKGTVAAVGRDFLTHFHLSYDGPAGRFAVRW